MGQSIVSGKKRQAIGKRLLAIGEKKNPIAYSYTVFSMNSKGFTLIELLIVMSIIAILATIAQPSFKQAAIRAREAVLKEDLFVFRDVIDKYYSDKGKYPSTLDDLAKEGYIRGIPKDPFTNSADTWQIIYSESEAEGEEKGIYDVHSGSDLIAVDGTPYNEW